MQHETGVGKTSANMVFSQPFPTAKQNSYFFLTNPEQHNLLPTKNIKKDNINPNQSRKNNSFHHGFQQKNKILLFSLRNPRTTTQKGLKYRT